MIFKLVATTSVNCSVAVTEALSVTLTVKVNVPLLVGLPVSAPVVAFKVKPAGNAPEITCHRKLGPVPPAAIKVNV